MINNLELIDRMPFGQYKGKTIEEIYKSENGAGYLVWLRAERAKNNNDRSLFSAEVSALLDMTIRQSSELRRRFDPWNLPVTSPGPQEREAEDSYDGVWGGF